MNTTGVGHLVARALDPVVVPAGFMAGQYGHDGGDEQVIFCAAYEELSRRHPRLPQAHQQQTPGACVDLVVDVQADGTLGRLELEGTSLAETLLRVGLDGDAEAVTRVRGRPAIESLPAIVAALQRLLGSPA